MTKVFRHAGYDVKIVIEDGVREVRIDLTSPVDG